MAQWHCWIGGKRYGPVSDDEVRKWSTEGRIRPDDLVWREGMVQWRSLRLVPELHGQAGWGALPGEDGFSPMPPAALVPPAPGGTGGRRTDGEITALARKKLRGRWGLPVAFALLLTLINVAVSSVPFVGDLASLILSGSLELGGVIFFLHFTRGQSGQKGELGMLFAGFKNFGNALGVHLLSALFVFLWSLLLIIPGIIAALAYSQAMYLIADNRGLGPLQAIRESKAMMRGHKGRLLRIHLRMFGWALLCVLTLGIGILFLMPYIRTSFACFYNDLLPPRAAEGVRGGENSEGTPTITS
jgi:uncharacterized membrane protein